ISHKRGVWKEPEANTIARPSGLHAGLSAYRSSKVSRTGSPSGAKLFERRSRNRSPMFVRANLTKTTARPSGDTAGLVSAYVWDGDVSALFSPLSADK